MAGENIITSATGPITQLGNNAVSMLILVLAGLVLVALIGGILFAIMQSRRYKQFKIFIWQKDGFGQLSQRIDEGGIFVDRKTGNKRLFLKDNKVGLDPDNIPFIPTSKGLKVVYVLQTGLKNFRYIKPIFDDNLIKFSVGEEDVNWAVNSYEAQKKRFNSNWLAQYFPFIVLAFSFIILAILMVTIFNKLPMIKEIAVEMKGVAELLVQARTGTTIIG